jgi:hypothetical protein
MKSLWVLLLDTSGSMGNPFRSAGVFDGPFEASNAETKIDAAKEILLKQLRGLASTDVIIIAFSDYPETVFRSSENNSTLLSSLQHVTAGGGTDIAAAIEHAMSEVHPNVIASILTITDGLSDYEPAVAAAQDAFSRGIRLSGILIDPTPEGEALLRAISLGGDVKAVGSAQSLDRAVGTAHDDMRETPPVAMARPHQEAAMFLHITIVTLFGILALGCIGGGIYAVYHNALSPTDFSLLGAHFSTGHVGVAFIGIGLLVAYFSVRSVLRNQRELAALPPDEFYLQKNKKMRNRK